MSTVSSLWASNFSAETYKSIRELFEEQSSLLPDLTEGKVSAEVIRIPQGDPYLNGSFVYKFRLLGKYIDNYRYYVCTFAHDISIYPVELRLDTDIAKEVDAEKIDIASISSGVYMLESEADAIALIAHILGSKRIRDVVGGIMKLSADTSPF